MVLPSTDNLKARLPKDNIDDHQRLENLKSNMRLAYNLAAKANRVTSDQQTILWS